MRWREGLDGGRIAGVTCAYFRTPRSHMADDYPQRLLAAQQSYSGFNDARKRAPVSLEICSYMQDWKNTFHYTRAEVQGIFDWAVKQHASTINLKSRAIPSDYRPIVDDALTKLGYRFRLASLSHESVWDGGQTLRLNSTWYNEGIAPIYLPYTLAFRVMDSANNVVAQGIRRMIYDVGSRAFIRLATHCPCRADWRKGNTPLRFRCWINPGRQELTLPTKESRAAAGIAYQR